MLFNKAYLAARYSRYPEMQEYAKQLQEIGYQITSRWINGGHDTVDANNDLDKSRFAVEDVEDLFNADTVINFTEDPRQEVTGRGRGGRHVELGLALAGYYDRYGMRSTLRIIVVGHRENVFHWLPVVEYFRTWEDCHIALRGEVKVQQEAQARRDADLDRLSRRLQ